MSEQRRKSKRRSAQLRRRRKGDLNEPSPLSEGVESELIGDLSSVHGVGQILVEGRVVDKGQLEVARRGREGKEGTNLLVGEDEKESVSELILVQHSSD